MAGGLVAMGFSPEQAEAAFAATGDVERALAILLEQAEGTDGGAPAAAAEDEAPLDVLADEQLELLVEMGYAPLVAANDDKTTKASSTRCSAASPPSSAARPPAPPADPCSDARCRPAATLK